IYVLVAALVVSGMYAGIGWTSGRAARDEADRMGSIQLRLLRQARDGLQDHLERIAERFKLVASSPSMNVEAFVSAASELDVNDAALFRYFDGNGKVVFENKTTVRVRRTSDDEVRQHLDWAKRSEELKDDGFSYELSESSPSAEGLVGEWLRLRIPVPGDGGSPNPGVLLFWCRSSQLLSRYLIPTHVLTESYTFALFSRRQIELGRGRTILDDAKPGEVADSVVWHFSETHWERSRPTEAQSFVDRLMTQLQVSEAEGDGSAVLYVPRRDGRTKQEVVAHASLVFGASRWILALSTPYDVATEFVGGLQTLLMLSTLLTVAVLAVGAALLYHQRQRLEVEASERHRLRLEELQHNYRELFAENPTSILVVDDDGLILDCNRSAERLVNQPGDRIIGRSVFDVFDPVVFQPLWDGMLKNGQLNTHDGRFVRRIDGTTVAADVWGRRIAEHWVLTIQDVEKQRDLDRQRARVRRLDSMGTLAS
ncbi:MAG: PAS domain-containing protein, partial [Planctomycetia bacterium]